MYCDVTIVHTRSCWASLFHSGDVSAHRVAYSGPASFSLCLPPLPPLPRMVSEFFSGVFGIGKEVLELGAMAERVLTGSACMQHMMTRTSSGVRLRKQLTNKP